MGRGGATIVVMKKHYALHILSVYV